ncbi:hypothetical protein B0T25DRAFT_563151 [Lasiosphaeria hispida]|uniref:Uncharacterized protein n=1 Tax=Lasiosphaeria hispida TaxID=260671 RepID=A0AAJ0HWY1_9PEZI|nr:hypothetical protein B0T25DRAFT_563151 [Lasiosphaeria hispida]
MPFGIQDELSKVDSSSKPASGYHRLKSIIAEVEVAPKVPTWDYHGGKFAVKTMTRRDNEFVSELREAVTQPSLWYLIGEGLLDELEY